MAGPQALMARRRLEDAGAKWDGSAGRAFNELPLSGVRVALAEDGRVPAHLTEAVELDARVVEQKGKVTAVTVEIRKESGQLVAIGRQCMAASMPRGVPQSKI